MSIADRRHRIILVTPRSSHLDNGVCVGFCDCWASWREGTVDRASCAIHLSDRPASTVHHFKINLSKANPRGNRNWAWALICRAAAREAADPATTGLGSSDWPARDRGLHQVALTLCPYHQPAGVPDPIDPYRTPRCHQAPISDAFGEFGRKGALRREPLTV